MSNSGSDKSANDFGSLLADARKANNYTVDEVSKYLKIPVHMIIALEKNDLQVLPVPTYAQGYIRAYAKFLEISEQKVLDIYNKAVPHENISDLKPRSTLPDEASSQSLVIKTITMLLILAGVAAVVFGGFQYYQKKAGDMATERQSRDQFFTGNSLDSPGISHLATQENAQLSENIDVAASKAEEKPVDQTNTNNTESSALSEIVTGSTENPDVKATLPSDETGNEQDIIEIFAENGSWVEVRDANNSRLLYNMLPAGSSKVLMGVAPFSISMGNAKTTQLTVNGIEIDVTSYITEKNIANFKVSTQGQNVFFH